FEKKISEEPLPEEGIFYLDLAIGAMKSALQKCLDIPFAELGVATPLDRSFSAEGVKYPDWRMWSQKEKLAAIEEVIQEDIRPYIELDAGGIEIIDLTEDLQLMIAYKGACTSCLSSTGSTLDAIQGILRAKIDPQIRVVPDASFLS
ncbi:MAG: NifU family protein, partial [Chlamydiales bacterium]|nr:NifU family protein [Chlamydiales bacterium]